MELYLLAPISAIIALVFAGILIRLIQSQKAGTPKMRDLSKKIKEGAATYLKRQYMTLSVFVIIVAGVLYFLISKMSSLGFILGALCSAVTGYTGMMVATTANVRRWVITESLLPLTWRRNFFQKRCFLNSIG